MKDIFCNRTLLIATKHGKERVLAPLLERALGVKCVTNTQFDTDSLGTFTREIERPDDPLATVRQKCLQAMALHQCDLAIASEGSFGTHPVYWYAPANEEILLLIDLQHGLEIAAQSLSLETNFAGKWLSSEAELWAFAKTVKFPSHGLVLREHPDKATIVYKGIDSPKQLLRRFWQIKKSQEAVYVETDMRAHYNPSRMHVIYQTGKQLLKKIASACPVCKMPGFDKVETKAGLPCEWCGLPTSDVQAFVYRCTHCQHTEERAFPFDRQWANPAYCYACNP